MLEIDKLKPPSIARRKSKKKVLVGLLKSVTPHKLYFVPDDGEQMTLWKSKWISIWDYDHQKKLIPADICVHAGRRVKIQVNFAESGLYACYIKPI